MLTAYVGERANRRHKPGRAFERTGYRFDVLCDYGAFRDLQRHRLLTLEWQTLAPAHGSDRPAAVEEAGLAPEVGSRDGGLGGDLGDRRRARGTGGRAVRRIDGLPHPVRHADDRSRGDAPHRAALIPAGSPTYRAIARKMHELIDTTAGHRAIAAAMRYSTTPTSISSDWRPSVAPRRSARPQASVASPGERAHLEHGTRTHQRHGTERSARGRDRRPRPDPRAPRTDAGRHRTGRDQRRRRPRTTDP